MALEQQSYLHDQEGSYHAQVYIKSIVSSAKTPSNRSTTTGASPSSGRTKIKALAKTHGVGL